MAQEIDRSEVSRALAKAIAFKNCGKDLESARWARKLVKLLDSADILIPFEDFRELCDTTN